MKARFYLFLLSWLMVMSCDPDESESISPEPFVENGVLEFIKYPGPGFGFDTIRLTFDFRDGDFDLGLASDDINPPYHLADFFLEQNGNLVKVIPTRESPTAPFLIDPGSGQSGKLATLRRLRKAMQSPPLLSCNNYFVASQGEVGMSNTAIIDASYKMADTILTAANQKIYTLASDTFLVDYNDNFYNIFIDYWFQQPDGSFQLFDWTKDVCHFYLYPRNFNGRFPNLTGNWSSPVVQYGPFKVRRTSRQKGVFIFEMNAADFRANFGSQKIKLAFSIQDRALNRSNVAETPVIEIPK